MTNLGDDYGDVSWFGLDEFGQPSGLNPMWGAATAALVGTGTAVALRKMQPAGTTMHTHAEGIGGLVAGLASGVMIAFPRSRAAGWTGLVTALVTNGIRELETLMAPSLPLAPPAIKGWGEMTIEPRPALSGFGMVTPEQVPSLQGALPQLLGQNSMGAGPVSQQVQMLGGPPISALGSHFGSTIFGGGN